MLRKRNRSLQKDQHNMGHNWDYCSQSYHGLGSKFRNDLIFNVPRLYVGLVPNSLLDSDSMRSPTSPLDVKVLPTSGNTARENPKSCLRSWDCSKVGLSILDSFDDDSSEFSEKITPSSESKIPIVSPRVKINFSNCLNSANSFEASKSLPKDFCKLPYTHNRSAKSDSNTLFEIGETCLEHEPFRKSLSSSMDSCNPLGSFTGLTHSNYDSDHGFFSVKDVSTQTNFPHFKERNHNPNSSLPTELNSKQVSSLELVESLSASEIEESEDYTCVISHGPNPKTTHIFGDCILETRSNNLRIRVKKEGKENGVFPVANCYQTPNQYPSNNFLSFCYHCNKKLEEGKDIYIYRGEKAFCSLTCRDLEIMVDELFQKSSDSDKSLEQREIREELYETSIL